MSAHREVRDEAQKVLGDRRVSRRRIADRLRRRGDLHGRQRVQHDPHAIKDEGITFGTADDPAVAKYAEQWAGQQVKTGDQARAFAKVMRTHTLETTGGLTYAQMGRFQSAAKPTIRRAPNDETAAAKDATVSRSRTAPGTSG